MIDQQANAQLLKLQERAAEYKMVLEQQASGLKMEYAEKKSLEDMQMRQYEIQRSYQESQRSLYQQQMNPGMRTQGQSMASVTQTGTAAPGTVLYDSAKQGAGMVPGQSMVAGGQQPIA